MKKTTFAVPALLAALSVLAPAPAQAQWSIEGRLGATLPTGDLSGTDGLNQTAGLALGADLMYTLSTNFTVYGGVGHHRFTCDGCEADVTTTGLDGGVKLLFGQDNGAMPWVRGGLMLHKPDVDGVSGDWHLGLDSGVGIDWQATPNLVLVPALRFNTYSTDGADLSYFIIDLGAHFHFSG